MTITIIISALAGMAIGFRFKVLLILPAIIAAALSTGAITAAQGHNFWAILLAIALSAIGVQVGYMCGTFASSVKEAQVPDTATATIAPADAYRATAGARYSDR